MVTSKPMGIKNVYFCTKDFIFFLYQNVKIVDVQMKSGFHIFILKKMQYFGRLEYHMYFVS